jgi:hypothetical protein
LTSKKRRDSKQVNGAPITATRIAHNGTVPFTTPVELHRGQSIGGTTRLRAGVCGGGP